MPDVGGVDLGGSDSFGDDGAGAAARAIRRYGKITFVDLAGSERLEQTESEGAMRTESGQINRSLFALGKVTLNPEWL